MTRKVEHAAIVIKRINAAGAVASPNGITLYSNNPNKVLNSLFFLSSINTSTLWYSIARPRVAKHFNSESVPKMSTIQGCGFAVILVTKLRFR